MEWSNEIVLTFLDYYAEEPVIWNALHPSYKKRDEVHDAWKRVEEKMGSEFSIMQLKKKKDSLMASYRVVAKRARSSTKSGGGAADGYKPVWFAYEKMASFLCGKEGPRTAFKSEDSVTYQISHDGSDEYDDYIQEGSPNVIPQKVDYGQKPGEDLYLNPRDTGRRILQKRKISNENLEDIREQMEDAYSTLHNIKQKEEKDYCDKYGDVVASRLRQLDEWHRDSAINKIDNILYEEKRIFLERVQSHSSGDYRPRE